MKNLKTADSAFLLEEALEQLHRETLSWVSEIKLWRKELNFFQKLLDAYSPKFTKEQKKRLDHFQNLLIYYDGELLDEFMHKSRLHEKYLARELAKETTFDEVEYRHKHIELRNDIEDFKKTFYHYKKEFFAFVGSVI